MGMYGEEKNNMYRQENGDDGGSREKKKNAEGQDNTRNDFSERDLSG